MVITTTAISFILLSLGLAFCGWRFRVAFRGAGNSEANKKIGFLVSLYFGGFAFQNSIIGFGTLFFAQNASGLFYVLVAANSFLSLVAVLGVYMVCYIFFPRSSPQIPVIITFALGVSSLILIFIAHPQPFITPTNGIEWNMPAPLAVMVFYLLLISIGASFYIFAKLFFQVKIREIKILSFVLVVAAIAGIVDAFVRFILLHGAVADVRTSIYDVGIGLIGTVFIVAFLIFFTIREKLRNHS